ncbi:RidA family protein [Marinisporobacter balticus]|uniref:2-iminobutanoate/2-iminopropanoate deaminase n=1 Tax=Marinisporobacter balticus TaxID=2018667 RepID=A0A4R2KB30_9FIRM|nr:Rid family detoxifying hydrolase [Marinisporobacter balticus]TCO69247.1 2-iminobutanoate/2-iminopropanoate deaminase [Marinisporobacter balticus]
MNRKAYTSPGAVVVGPYSQAVESGDIVFISGQTPLNPETGLLVEGGIEQQTEQCFINLIKVLDVAGLTMDHVDKVSVYLTNMDNFSGMNAVYSKQFNSPYPARTTLGVASLPMNAQIEIELIARRK